MGNFLKKLFFILLTRNTATAVARIQIDLKKHHIILLYAFNEKVYQNIENWESPHHQFHAPRL
jgi:hypothetical protein